MEKDKLQQILNSHKEWLDTRFTNNVQGECADLRGENLRSADLQGANLSYANLQRANLQETNLRKADMRRANLHDADLQSENASAETKKELSKLIDFANEFHRVQECGLIESLPESEADTELAEK